MPTNFKEKLQNHNSVSKCAFVMCVDNDLIIMARLKPETPSLNTWLWIQKHQHRTEITIFKVLMKACFTTF